MTQPRNRFIQDIARDISEDGRALEELRRQQIPDFIRNRDRQPAQPTSRFLDFQFPEFKEPEPFPSTARVTAPFRPEVSREIEEQRRREFPFPDLPQEGLDLGEGLTLQRTGKVRHPDVRFPLGSLDPETGQFRKSFQVHGLTALEKPLKVIETAFIPASFIGAGIGYLGEELEKRSKFTEEEWQAYKEAGLPVASPEDFKKFLPGGEYYKRLRETPFWTRLALEIPFWAGLAHGGVSSLRGIKALEEAAKAGTIPQEMATAGRVVLESTTLPTVERVTGFAIDQTLGRLFRALFGISGQIKGKITAAKLRARWEQAPGRTIFAKGSTQEKEMLRVFELYEKFPNKPNLAYREFQGVYKDDPAFWRGVKAKYPEMGRLGELSQDDISVLMGLVRKAPSPPQPTPSGTAVSGQRVPLATIQAGARAEIPTVESIANKIINRQALNPAEEQFRVNNAQAVEDALASRVAIPTEPAVTPQPPPEAPRAKISPVAEKPRIPPVTAERSVQNIQEQGRTAPESVPPEQAEFSHKELAAPDGPKPPQPPDVAVSAAREPGDILREIASKAAKGERPDQTLLRLFEAKINNLKRQSSLTVRGINDQLHELGIGTWRRNQLIHNPKDKEMLLELNNALHNPSKVASGEITVPEGYEAIYRQLRELADWDTASRLQFDPKAATLADWFFRGWKPPEGMYTDVPFGGALGKQPKPLRTPRVDASFDEMIELGFEPLFLNPAYQWEYRHNLGETYRLQMGLVETLKGMGDDLIRPHDGGPVPQGWRVPEVGPAFEGQPFAIADPKTGEPSVMYSRRWIVNDKVANTLENIFGKRPNLQKFTIAGKTIDPLTIIDAMTFIPKRAKLMFSFFQQVDFLTRAGTNSWARGVDELQVGHPIEALKAPMRYPQAAMEILHANFSPTKRLSLAKQLDDTTPLIEGRTGIHFKGISEAGLSTIDPTIFPADMDKLVHQLAEETGALKKIPQAIGDLESAMRRGLFQGVYPAAMMTSIKNNIAPMVTRQHPSLNDAQINAEIARIANTLFSTIPPAQSVIQNRGVRETLRRAFFSIGESEGLLRQATGAVKGPNAAFWRKHYLGAYLFLMTVAFIIHFASTGESLPKERWTPIAKDKWGPLPFGYNTEFAAPTLPIKGRGDVELTLDLVGQMDTALRILNPVNFITSRESVPVRSLMNQINGVDFYGAPIDDVGPGGIISRTSQLLHDLFAPIGVGGISGELVRKGVPGAEDVIPRGEERLGLSGLALQATGINIRAETTRNLLNRFARESGLTKADGTPVTSWDDLEPYQKKEVSNNEQLQNELGLRSVAAVERQQLGALGFATLDALDQERIVRGEALVVEFFSQIHTPEEFRDHVKLLKNEISAKKAQADADFQLFEDTGKLPIAPNKRALTEYYNTFELAKRKPSETIDWDKQEAIENYLRDKWTGTQEAYVDRNIGLTEWGPLMAEYNQAVERLKVYWETPERERRRLRQVNLDIDAMLVRWYGYKPAVRGATPAPIPPTVPSLDIPNFIKNRNR